MVESGWSFRSFRLEASFLALLSFLPRRPNFRVRTTFFPTIGATTVISIPSVALEDFAVPDLFVGVQPILVPPRLSARSPAQPAAPVGAAPAPPPSSGD